jgi:hypothetical protein
MKIKDIVEARMSAAVKLQRAFEREQSKSTASKQRADQAKAEFEKEWKANQAKEQPTKEDAAGVGIITKQNTTADVNKNTPKKNLRAFRL